MTAGRFRTTHEAAPANVGASAIPGSRQMPGADAFAESSASALPAAR